LQSKTLQIVIYKPIILKFKVKLEIKKMAAVPSKEISSEKEDKSLCL